MRRLIHSERRRHPRKTDPLVAAKAAAALQSGLGRSSGHAMSASPSERRVRLEGQVGFAGAVAGMTNAPERVNDDETAGLVV